MWQYIGTVFLGVRKTGSTFLYCNYQFASFVAYFITHVITQMGEILTKGNNNWKEKYGLPPW